MPLIYIVLMLIMVGVGLWFINTYVPMASSIRTIVNIGVVIAVCVVILNAGNLWGTVNELSLAG